MTYRGKFRPNNISKYRGDASSITYRSLWERQAFRWLDENPDVLEWNSEEIVIPYRCKTDGKRHRYFIDLYVKFKTGQVFLIEIKPEKQTREPKKPKRQSQKYLREVMTYAKNISKWETARKYCEERGWLFEIWTEKSLKKLGIKLLTA
jgi:hypothetical protein